MPNNLDELMATYRTALSANVGSLDLALLEDKIWEMHKRIAGRGASKVSEKRDYFAKHFGGQGSVYEKRGTVLRAGEWAWICFGLLDREKITYSGAGTILRAVRHVSRATGIDHRQVMAQALKQYAGTVKSLEKLELNVTRGKGKPVDETAPYSNKALTSSKEFRSRVHRVVEGFLKATFKSNSVTDYYRGQLEDEFMASIDVDIDSLRRGIQQSKRHARNEIMATVNEQDFNLACEVLGCSFVFGNKLTDKEVALMKRRHKRRAADLHPDTNTDDESKAEYDRVNRALEVLTAYIRIRREAS